ncbi:hypothetical protein HDU97_007154 [Phlyctochytrium planicorne]|nr:hypothetical protein HDU97_007154 [Phlyctochytrium planicorne]
MTITNNKTTREALFWGSLIAGGIGVVTGISLAHLIPSVKAWLGLTPATTEPEEIDYVPPEALTAQIHSLPIVKRLQSLNLEIIPFRPLLTNLLIENQSTLIVDKHQENPGAFSEQLVRGRTLYGKGRIEYGVGFWAKEEKTMVKAIRIGERVCGHAGLVHGGMVAAAFDDFMGSVFFTNAGGHYSGFTAYLKVDYRVPIPSPITVILILWIEKEEGRKIFIKGQLKSAESAPEGMKVAPAGEKGERWGEAGSVLFAEAEALFVIPKGDWEREVERRKNVVNVEN